MNTLPYFMRMLTFTGDDAQAIRRLSTDALRAALAADDKARGNPWALAEAHCELAMRERLGIAARVEG